MTRLICIYLCSLTFLLFGGLAPACAAPRASVDVPRVAPSASVGGTSATARPTLRVSLTEDTSVVSTGASQGTVVPSGQPDTTPSTPPSDPPTSQEAPASGPGEPSVDVLSNGNSDFGFTCPPETWKQEVSFSYVEQEQLHAWQQQMGQMDSAQMQQYYENLQGTLSNAVNSSNPNGVLDAQIYDYANQVIISCVRSSGCFDPKTKIAMADGSSKKVEDISAGDLLLNPISKAAVKVKRVIEGPEKAPLVDIAIGDMHLRVSELHPVETLAGVKKAVELSSSDSVMGADGKFHKVSSLERPPVAPRQRVVNFELDVSSSRPEDHMVLSEGIVTGDFTLQNSLNGK